MSPQFVDFNGDGHVDIVAGTFDGSPHVAFGTAKGWKQPEQILDRDGERIVFNQFWNYDEEKWDETDRCDPDGHALAHGHLTSAIAFDWDADGDFDLLLGDHDTGHVYLRLNEGSAEHPAFTRKNVAVHADGAPIDVPGTVATLRAVDWDGDGLLDLLCGGMGDAYRDEQGGGVYLYRNTGTAEAPAFAAAHELVPPSAKGASRPMRPDSGLYMDAADHDGDGDLDLLVGGYSHWKPPAPELTAEQKARVAELQAELGRIDEKSREFSLTVRHATQDLDREAAAAKRAELYEAAAAELEARRTRRAAITAELDPLVPGKKRRSFVWLYENRSEPAADPPGGAR